MKYKPFQRKIIAKGFQDLKTFDDFIQSSLDKYKFVDPAKELYTNVGEYSKYIISNKSTIPDLIIYNKTFNKNECFQDYKGSHFNKFPRVRYILKAKPRKQFMNKNLTNKNNKHEELKGEVSKSENDNGKEEIDDNKIEVNIKEENDKDYDDNVVDNIKVKEKEDFDLSENDIYKNLSEEIVLTNPTMFFNQIKENDIKFREFKGINFQQEKNESDKEKENKNDINEFKENNNIIIINSKVDANANIKLENLPKSKTPSIIHGKNNSNQIIQSFSELLFEHSNKYKNTPKKEDNIDEVKENKEILIKDTEKQINKDKTIYNQSNNNLLYNGIHISKYDADNQTNRQIPKIRTQFIPQVSPFLYMPPMTPSGPSIINQGQLNFPFNYPIINPMNFLPFPLEEPSEVENDPIFNTFNEDYSRYNPTIFLEKPILIVKKNLIDRNWFIMKNNKIYGNYNSEELLYFLGEQIRKGNKFENISVTDYHTDVFFKPSNLFDILRHSVPILKRKFFQQKLMPLPYTMNNPNLINQNMIKNQTIDNNK